MWNGLQPERSTLSRGHSAASPLAKGRVVLISRSPFRVPLMQVLWGSVERRRRDCAPGCPAALEHLAVIQ
jgi:hypothetical protein